MAKNVLSVRDIEGAKRREKPYKLFDGGGLYLLVRPDGARYWRLKYRVDGVEKLVSLGTYPARSLKAAREEGEKARALLGRGIDPSQHRRTEKADRRTARENTFEAVAREWFGKQRRKWVASHAEKVSGRLERHLFPRIGSAAISGLTGAELVEVLKAIEQSATVSTAHRCRQYLDAVCRYAMYTARLESNPTPRSEVLTPIERGSYASIKDPKGVGGLIRAIGGYEGSAVTVAALRLAPLVFVRPGELRAAEWSEIDLTTAEWKIPAERMKMGRPHLVPLSTQAVTVLEELQRLTGEGRFVFPSERSPGRCMSENTVNAALRSMGYAKDQMTGHGFRHMASTLLNESRNFRGEVIERQLAHVDRNTIRSIYNAAEYLEERQHMMQWWADRLDALATASDKVVSIAAHR